jgi:NitT/TauT family transport system permease protein
MFTGKTLPLTGGVSGKIPFPRGAGKFLPLFFISATLAIQVAIPNSGEHPVVPRPYFTYFLTGALVLYAVMSAVSPSGKRLGKALSYRGVFISGIFMFAGCLNVVTSKLALLPVLYFPSLDKVLGVIVEDRALLMKCVAYSGRLLFFGYSGGVLLGLVTGICVGFSKKAAYWASPLIRVLGPIPSSAWIPLVLIVFPSAFSASAFLVGVAVWFPTTVMTSSGILNVRQAYFEVGSTLGANAFHRVFKIGVPAAMPHIFLGLFNGACASFITLVTAEMIGAKYGIGWYINWQKDMLSYANVYAGLIIIAVLFSVLMTALFRVRDHLLVWQKGVIKW